MSRNRYGVTIDLLNKLYPLVGAIVITWSIVESSLEQSVIILYRHAGGNALESQVPMQLDRKIKFCRKCFNSIPALKKHKREAVAVLDRIKTLSNIRHDLIHGAVSDYTPKTRKIGFSRLRGEQLYQPSYTLKQLLTAHKRLMTLQTDMLRLTGVLVDEFMSQDNV